METVELGSYEKCQDLRALLKRKHRFILLRSPGNKVGLSLLGLTLLQAGVCLGRSPWRLSKPRPGCSPRILCGVCLRLKSGAATGGTFCPFCPGVFPAPG